MNRTFIFLKDTDISPQDKTRDLYTLFVNETREMNLADAVQVVRVADIGVYNKGVVVRVVPGDVLYSGVRDTDVRRIIESARDGRVLEDIQCKDRSKQVKVVLRNCGIVDPDSIDDAIAHDGYMALRKVLSDYTPEKAIEEMKKSGLRGRGGAGYPTWMKWKFTRQEKSEEKYIICNGDEGDPGAYMDRSVLEGDPHSVIEGMAIAGFIIGARQGFFYIRAEYPLAIQRVEKAIRQAYDYGLLGQDILGSGFSFDVEVRLGAGAFVCGEETALIASIEGKRGTPRPRPPYPSVKGLWDKPTAINNVETLANVPVIFLKGGSWFGSLGTEKSKGTKVFAVTGKVKNSGLVEVPMGITLREIVFDIGGGVLNNRKIKAVQTGGPSGGVIPKDKLDTPVDYENLQKLGSIVGSGGMIVMDEDDCMVDIAKFYLKFCVDESCGKCAPCRIGGFQMLDILNRISEGKASMDDLKKLKSISQAMQTASLCGLGQTAPNPVVSTLNYFEDEYKAHILNKKCPAGKCRELLTYSIIQGKCKRCRVCVVNCPVNAIGGDREKGFYVQLDKCTKCGKCMEVCKFAAILRE